MTRTAGPAVRRVWGLIWVSALAAVLAAATAPGAAGGAPGEAARVEELLARLSRAEKISLVGGVGFETRGIKRLGIPQLTMTDGPVGVRWGTATAFPAGIALAATWDTALVHDVARAIALEARAKGRSMLLGPCVNIARVPLGGRTFEGFGEDPWLASRLAVAYVHGVQSVGVAATVKHFAANNQEWKRDSIDARIDERALREIYLPAFAAAVAEGGSWAVMSAYNKLNGAWCSENPSLLHDVLKREWGFDGLVVSDWGAVHSTSATANAGLDLEMPDARYLADSTLAGPVASGAVPEATLDDMVRRQLRVLARTGALDAPATAGAAATTAPDHGELALAAARRSLVLLQNADGLLPLDRTSIRSLAVIGPNASVARTGGGGSSYVSAAAAIAPLDGVRRAAGSGVTVSYAQGVTMQGEVTPVETGALMPARGSGAAHGMRGEYFASMDLSGRPALVRVDATVDFDWADRAPAPGLPIDRFSVRWTGSLVPPVSGSYELSVRGDDGVRLIVDGRKVLEDWSDHGPRTSSAFMELQAGRRYAVVLEFYENGGGAVVQFGWRRTGEDRLAAAEAAARAADVAVVLVGDSPDIESEGFDRARMDLPDGQPALIRAVAAANPRTVVVVVSGAPVTMGEWLARVPAVVQAWFPGEQGGTAIGELLFGDVVPCGKLPISFLQRWEDSSAYPTYPGRDLATDYADGVFVGYRHLDREGIAPHFPFGHGLSYTTFAYSDLRIEPVGPRAEDRFRVEFTLSNTGARRGAEVAQLYVAPPAANVPRPPRELKGFARVELDPGQSLRVTLELDRGAFEYFDPTRHRWTLEPGRFDVHVGASSRDLRLTGAVDVGARASAE